MRLLFPKRTPRDPDDHPTSRLVDRILREAAGSRASDLHVGPAGEGRGLVRLRVDGFFREREALEPGLLPRVIARLKVLAGLAVFKTGEPQDGAIRLETEAGPMDLRLSTIPVVGGEKAVVRFFEHAGSPRLLPDLGFPAPVEEKVRGLLSLPAGIVLVIGPCSSGKTTTLYALARQIIASRGRYTNIVSVEDPVEQRIEGMSQTEIDLPRGLTYARALTALLRQDPEVLLLAETRDPVTARMGVEAGFTGHRVLTSMHVGRPGDVPRRLALMGVPEYLIAESLRGVVNQRLLRRRCPCRGTEGCERCGGTGFHGRFAVGEVVHFRGGEAVAMTPPLREVAARAVAAGETAEDELRRVLGEEASA